MVTKQIELGHKLYLTTVGIGDRKWCVRTTPVGHDTNEHVTMIGTSEECSVIHPGYEERRALGYVSPNKDAARAHHDRVVAAATLSWV